MVTLFSGDEGMLTSLLILAACLDTIRDTGSCPQGAQPNRSNLGSLIGMSAKRDRSIFLLMEILGDYSGEMEAQNG